MKLLFLLMFWNFSQLKALNDHVQMEVCHIEITNEAPEFLKLAYQDWLRKIFFREKLFELQRNSFFFESEISLFATKFLCIYPETPVSFELYQIPNGLYLNFQLISWHYTYTRSGYIYFVIAGPFPVKLPIKNAPNKILWYRKIRCQILGASLALFELSWIAYQTLQPKKGKNERNC